MAEIGFRVIRNFCLIVLLLLGIGSCTHTVAHTPIGTTNIRIIDSLPWPAALTSVTLDTEQPDIEAQIFVNSWDEFIPLNLLPKLPAGMRVFVTFSRLDEVSIAWANAHQFSIVSDCEPPLSISIQNIACGPLTDDDQIEALKQLKQLRSISVSSFTMTNC